MLEKSRRHLQRYREVGRILARHGWGWMIGRLGIADIIGHKAVPTSESTPVHLREMLEELGPAFVKMGQLLSTRPDIVPEPYLSELCKLQDTASTLPFDQVLQVIESEFDARLYELFSEFDETPLAAASLAQVHRAKLADGTPVIVKVQRPNIREQIEIDIEIMYKRAKFLENHWDRARSYGIMDVVDEFATTIREELDYTREARNTDLLRDKAERYKLVQVPHVYWHLTTNRVLTLEAMQGTKITDIPDIVDKHQVANSLASAFCEQIFVDGFFHADPHPGNILVTNEGVIQLVDCGQARRIDPESKAGAVRMLMAFEQEDNRALADDVVNLGIAREEVDMNALTQDLGKLLRSFYNMPSSAVDMGKLLMGVLNVSAGHKIRLPVVFAVMGKVFNNVDGICRQLDSSFNFTQIARGYVGKAVRNELRTEGVVTELYRAAVSLKSFLFSLPENLERLMRKAVEGNVRIEFKHLGLEEVSESLRVASNRISIALIVGSIVVGSSLVIVAGRGPKSWFSLPLFGIIGYIVASVFGVMLIMSIIRPGKHK